MRRMKYRTIGVVLAVMAGAWAAEGAAWRAVATKAGDEVRLVTYSGLICRAAGKAIPEALFGKDLKIVGQLSMVKKSAPDAMRTLTVQVVEEIPPPVAATGFIPGKPGFYAKTDRKLPADQLKPDATIELELPELGNSAMSGGGAPIKMAVKLPVNYRISTAHPVIIHFHGGTGSPIGGFQWRSIVGDRNYIIVGADYNHAENEKRGLLAIGTCRDFDSAIARHVLQILRNSTVFDQSTVILSGMSSGAYSITDLFRGGSRKGWEPFAGFCAIAGGAKTDGARLDQRSVLFLMGKNDTLRHKWLEEAVNSLRGNAKINVCMVDNVGHEWSNAFTPYMLDWLDRDFPAIAAIRARREAMAALAADPAAVRVIQGWVDAIGLD